ncbi:aminoglycoside 2'-N-acetyltransferase I [Kibdelosporangium phytohabitans]|uniref:Aminoglycoside 2'-N-acetyltransferase n=1 Tax=Kibdelosporangium phytohabitans TaxID=860235 RepID=A0A0N9II58_9PSEU|nr:GNAT family N-acetyltransferase [Kibdelosporangium phytohabitans]ALG14672.1 aminoglycoside 2'-N-acetyltransferase [Kibdelosporangium phytohabitans]MBE1468522.1 aminoglycoside 2'-N-acetyltransferase I [Kibdelosporangium phytohabitans]
MTQLRTAHTADLDTATRATIRDLMTTGFDGDFSDEDWNHALGGMHALLWDGQDLIAHGAVVQRRMLVEGRPLRAGHVEAVAVRPDRRRQGHGGTVMAELERIVRGAYDLGVLGASDDGAALYRSRGWQLWEGPSSVVTPDGLARTEDDDGNIYVLPVAVQLDLSGAIACDWRDGDVW